MIYVSYNQGYKSGGFNAADDQNPAFESVNGVKTPLRTVPGIGFEYDDETADSFEIGGKHTLANVCLPPISNESAVSSSYSKPIPGTVLNGVFTPLTDSNAGF